MVDKVTRWLLLVSILSYFPGVPIKVFGLRVFYASVMCLVAAAAFDTPSTSSRSTRTRPLLGVFITVGLINLIFHRLEPVVLSAVTSLTLAGVAYHILSSYYVDTEKCKQYILAACYINIVIYLFQRAGVYFFYDGIVHPAGLMGNPPRLVTMLAISFPLAASKNIFLAIPFLLISWVEMELAMFAVAGYWLYQTYFTYFCRRYYRIPPYVLSAALLVPLAAVTACFGRPIFRSICDRVNVWYIPIRIFFTDPVRGFGLGVVPWHEKTLVAVENDGTILSSLLQYILSGGLTTITFLAKFVKDFLLVHVRRNNAWSVAAVGTCILSIVEYPFEIPRLWFLITAIFAFATVATVTQKEGSYARENSTD